MKGTCSSRPSPRHTPGRPAWIASVGRGVAIGACTLGLGALAVGCGKTMTEQDCQKLADHMREVWNAEAARAAPEDGPVAEKASAVIQSEGERTVGEFLSECKQQLEGRRVDASEVDCILDAKTMAGIKECDRK